MQFNRQSIVHSTLQIAFGRLQRMPQLKAVASLLFQQTTRRFSEARFRYDMGEEGKGKGGGGAAPTLATIAVVYSNSSLLERPALATAHRLWFQQ